MSVIEDMPLSLPTGSELAGSENGGSSEHRAVRSNRSFELPALNQDRTKFSSEPSHSMGDLPPIELERADFAAFSHGDLPPIDQLGFDAADLATQSLPVDLTLTQWKKSWSVYILGYWLLLNTVKSKYVDVVSMEPAARISLQLNSTYIPLIPD